MFDVRKQLMNRWIFWLGGSTGKKKLHMIKVIYRIFLKGKNSIIKWMQKQIPQNNAPNCIPAARGAIWLPRSDKPRRRIGPGLRALESRHPAIFPPENLWPCPPPTVSSVFRECRIGERKLDNRGITPRRVSERERKKKTQRIEHRKWLVVDFFGVFISISVSVSSWPTKMAITSRNGHCEGGKRVGLSQGVE